MFKKPSNVNIGAGKKGVDAKVDVDLGPLHSTQSGSADIGKSGYTVKTSSETNIGGVIGSNDSHSESINKSGLSTTQSHSEELFGLHSSESKGFSVGKGGIERSPPVSG